MQSNPVVPLTHEVRRILTYLALRSDLKLGTADAKNGYLQAPRSTNSEKIFMRIPDWVPNPKGIQNRVAEIHKAVYGLPDSGREFQTYVSSILRKLSFKELKNFPGVFKRIKKDGSVEYVGVYVDDLYLCGKDINALAAEIHSGGLLLGQVDELKPGSTVKYNGLEIFYGDKFLCEHMTRYTEILIEKFVTMMSGSAKSNFILKKHDTPGYSIHDAEKFSEPSEILFHDKDYDPHSLVAALLYLSRLARPDISHSVSFLTRQIHCWSVGADEALKKLFGYLSVTYNLSIFQPLPEIDPEALGREVIEYFSDADLAGDVLSSRSCGGDHTFLTFYDRSGKKKQWLLSWCSKMLTQKPTSTCWSELASHQRGLQDRALPLSLLLEDLTKFEAPVHGHLDNTAGVSAIKHGYSPVLRHLARHSRLSLVHLNAIYIDGGSCLAYVESSKKVSDIGTKPLPSQLHWNCVIMLQMAILDLG
jgi:hypothetical protein